MTFYRIANRLAARSAVVKVSSRVGVRTPRRTLSADSQFESTSTTSHTLPRLAQPSIWTSLIPSFLRRRRPDDSVRKKKSREWNPATFFIVIFTLIGSQAIQMIAIRNDSSAFSRQADAKIGLLKEVIERVQRGEVVDVAGLLGTGDKSREREWEDVLREIQEEDALWRKRSKKRNKESSAASEDSSHAEKSSVPSNATQLPQESNPEAKKEEVPAQDRGQTPRGYY